MTRGIRSLTTCCPLALLSSTLLPARSLRTQNTAMTTDALNAQQENQNHTYVSNVIPWYVRLIWLLFWIFVIYYSIKYFLPAIQSELLTPP